jgi:LysR family transcriptional regulator, glycine cleavage system transcriptional activator
MQIPRPSLNALRAFEATARLRSMSAAAAELMVTPGAVSRHVRSLEDLFGVALLKRGSHNVEPTAEGARLTEGLSTAFYMIDASVSQLRPGPLTLSCSATIMMYWLIPRIAKFHALHPGIEVRFNMNYDQINFVHDQISVAIRNSMIPLPRDVYSRDLITEWIGPVCSPSYKFASGMRKPSDLSKVQLLSTKTRPQGWREWAEAFRAKDLKLRTVGEYDHFYLLIQAALCGLGVALVPRILVEDDLLTGRLIAPFGFVEGPHRLVLWIAPHLRSRADTKALVSWLEKEMRLPPSAPTV